MIKRILTKVFVRFKKRQSRFIESEADKTNEVLSGFGKSRGREATVFVIGANNGVENDPYVHHALDFGWRAVLVEPNPGVFADLQRTFGSLPRVDCVNAAIGNKSTPLVLYTIAFSAKRWATGLSSASETTLRKHFASGWVQQMCERFGDVLPTDPNEWVKPIEVRCKTVRELVQEAGVQCIDVLAVDTEGMDAEIVNNALDQGYRPEVICWEHLHLSPETNGDLVRRCEDLGYEVMSDTNNIVCRKQR